MTESENQTIPERDYRLTWVLGALIVFGLIVTTIGNEPRVQDWDPQYSKVVVDRTAAYGGTFYENGIFSKGPLELLVHRVGAVILPDDGHWLFIAFMSGLLALVVAWAASRTARWAGASAPFGVVVGVFTFFHFAFSDADYSGVVYPRNLTAALFAIVWVLLLNERRWSTPRRRVGAVAVAAAIIGLAVQSLLSSVFTALVLLVAGFLLLRELVPGWERLKLGGVTFIVGDVVFLSAVLWYAARGAFEEFWASWFVYARYIAVGTESPLGSQLGLGWDSIYAYHVRVPLVAVIVAVFIATAVLSWKAWSRRQRILVAALGGWWATAWLEMILTQRYSSHYFSITAVPVTLMLAFLVGTAYRRIAPSDPRWEGRPWWPVAAVLVAIFTIGPSNFGRAVYDTIHFPGTAGLDAIDDKFSTGNARTARAILDLYTDEGDPLLAWTNEPWPYLQLERVSATRFPWKSFLIGEIYLGKTSPDYVLPQTWGWFAEDLAESDPVTFIEANWTLVDGNPLADHVRADFTTVYTGTPIAVWLRNDLASEVLEHRASTPWEPIAPAPEGWVASTGTASWVSGSNHLPLGDRCFRLEGTIQFAPDAGEIIRFSFTDPSGIEEGLHIGIDRGGAYTGSDFVRYEETTLGDAGLGIKDFSLIVGGRSAVLVMQGEVVAALRLLRPVRVGIEARTPLTLTALVSGAAPVASGCG